MNILSKEQKTYIEEHAVEILNERGISKAQFAKAMGVIPQNFNKLVGTKNVVTLTHIADYLDIPLQVLLFGYEENEPDIHGVLYINEKAVIVDNKEELRKIVKELSVV